MEIAERKALFIDRQLNISKNESGSNSRISQEALHLGKTKDFTPFHYWQQQNIDSR
jgi:hypothetical protein